MRPLCRFFALTSLACLCAWADGITTQASCSILNNPAATAPDHCAMGIFGQGSATASAWGGVTSPETASGFWIAALSTSVEATSNFPGGTLMAGTARSSATINLTFASDGPSRAGYLDVQFPAFAFGPGNGGWTDTASFAFGSFFSGNCSGFLYSCVSLGQRIGQSPFGRTGDILIPFALGQSFSFTFTTDAFAEGGLYDEAHSDTGGSGTIEFRLLDSSGNPTELQLIPEPVSWGLIAACLVVLVIPIVRRRLLHPVS
jgi:hypothetical protein